jgi:type II secretory pathway pseudopilin PulG
MQTKTQLHNGITLLEVLASIFVVSIGLLGVLAVIPFGAFQVSKARQTEYASNMLANAADEIYIRDMAKPREWGFDTSIREEVDLAGTRSFAGSDSTRTYTYVTREDGTSPPSLTITTITADVTARIGTITVVPYHHTLIDSYGNTVLTRIDIHVSAPITIDVSERVEWKRWQGNLDISRNPDTQGDDTYNYTPYSRNYTDIIQHYALNCTRFICFDPRAATMPNVSHIFPLPTFLPANGRKALVARWENTFRGRDDLDYTADDGDRPKFKDDKPISAGKYSWFFTFLPQPNEGWMNSVSSNIEISSRSVDVRLRHAGVDIVVPVHDRNITVSMPQRMDMVHERFVQRTAVADILACYNRVPDDDRQIPIPNADFSASLGGGTFTFPDASHLELLTQTKYVFVTWETAQGLKGEWCKIVFVDKSNSAIPKVIVTGNLSDVDDNDIQVYIPSGVLYHKRVEDVPIK